jgi:hypothetical protein
MSSFAPRARLRYPARQTCRFGCCAPYLSPRAALTNRHGKFSPTHRSPRASHRRRPPRAADALLALPRAAALRRRDAAPPPLKLRLPRHPSAAQRDLLRGDPIGEERIGLDTFETAHEAARAYDAVAWRLGRLRRSMNFDDVTTRAQAEMLAPPPPAVTREQQARQRELEQRLLIAERDERLRLEWRE